MKDFSSEKKTKDQKPNTRNILAIDIGNSFTKFALFENETLQERLKIPTVRYADDISIPDFNYKIHAVVIASVVPELRNAYCKFSENRFNLEPIFVDSTFDFGLKINYFPSESLGVDRLVNAFAAAEKYGAPCVVCSLGTATTIDLVNAKREFAGGIIAPGMRLMSESLFQKTAKLPQIEITQAEKIIGNSTVEAIQAGVYFGSVALVDGIVERMFDELGETAKVIATGGLAKEIAAESKRIEIVDENLLLEGLRLVYQKRFA